MCVHILTSVLVRQDSHGVMGHACTVLRSTLRGALRNRDGAASFAVRLPPLSSPVVGMLL